MNEMFVSLKFKPRAWEEEIKMCVFSSRTK